MKNSIHISAIILTFLFQNILRSQDNNLDGWQKCGSKPDSYNIGLDDEKYNDKPVYFLKSNTDVIGGFGTIAKNIMPDMYIGKRLRLSGYIRTINSSGTGMWMRVDGNEMGKSLQFDNMGSRQIMGTTEWQKYEIVLDIPATSRGIYYGVLTTGSGGTCR